MASALANYSSALNNIFVYVGMRAYPSEEPIEEVGGKLEGENNLARCGSGELSGTHVLRLLEHEQDILHHTFSLSKSAVDGPLTGLLQKFIDDFMDGGRLLTEARNFVDAMPICGPNAFWLDAIWHEMQHSAHVCNLFLGDGYFFGGLVHASQMNSEWTKDISART